MKMTTMVAMALVAGLSTRSGQAERRVEWRLTVYVENNASVPFPLLSQARTLAAQMFAGIGVQIDWRAGARAESQLIREKAIAVRLTLEDPQGLNPSVGAFTAPTEGVHITVLYCRLAWSLAKPHLAPALLAHVLVHEIAHILEGVGRHSKTGIMKANWTSSDYYDMQTKTLPFASEDIELIHQGLAQRSSSGSTAVWSTPSKIAPAR
jgi:hypothetical protein